MPEVKVSIGGREFTVSCQEGEEHYLHAAAAMLDTEATALSAQIGRLPEARMLLMAGLMLADKAAGMEEQMRAAQDKATTLESQMDGGAPEPERVEVAVIPEGVIDSFAELAARAEALAAAVEEKAAAG